MLLNNTVVISAAGSRKTTYIVEQSLGNPTEEILILTYTIENLNQIKDYFIELNGIVPKNVKIQGWYTFLLQDCVRPYQSFVYPNQRIENIFLISGKSALFANKNDVKKYFLTKSETIYTDKISEFACRCNELSDGLVVGRLEGIYHRIYIDEVQDLAGYDFELLELLFKSQISITVVGDNRQATYATNYSPRYATFKGQNIIKLFKEWEQKRLCSIQERNECYRCNQSICDFADLLYPEMAKSVSKQIRKTDHDGLFLVSRKDLDSYLQEHRPVILRYKISKETECLEAINFGLSKGQTFDRILIFPTGPIRNYLKTGKLEAIGDKPKFYVAITRAKFSVAFLYDSTSCFPQIMRYTQKN